MNATKPQPRRSARLAAKPRTHYAQADARLDAVVEKYVDPDAYAAKKARAARREEVRRLERAHRVARAEMRRKLAGHISHLATQIIGARAVYQTLSAIEKSILEDEAKELVAKAHPVWTPANLNWAFKHVIGY